MTVTIFKTVNNKKYKKYEITFKTNSEHIYLSNFIKSNVDKVTIYMNLKKFYLNYEYEYFDKKTNKIHLKKTNENKFITDLAFLSSFLEKTTNDYDMKYDFYIDINDIDPKKLKLIKNIADDYEDDISFKEIEDSKIDDKYLEPINLQYNETDCILEKIDIDVIDKIVIKSDYDKKLYVLQCPFGTNLNQLGIPSPNNINFLYLKNEYNESEIDIDINQLLNSKIVFKTSDEIILNNMFIGINHPLNIETLTSFDKTMKTKNNISIILDIIDF